MLDTLQVHLTNENVKTIGEYIKDYSFLITLIVGAFLGFLLNRIYEMISFNEKRWFFFHALYELTNALEHQITLYRSYVENLKSNKNHLESLQKNVGFNLKSINIVSKEVLFKIFVKKFLPEDTHHLKRLTVLNNGFNLIEHHSEIDEVQDGKIRDINKSYLQKYSDSRTKLLKDIDIFIAAFDDPTDQNFVSFALEYDAFIKSFYKNDYKKDNHSIFDDKEKFLEKLFGIVQKYGFVEPVHEISAMFHIVGELESNRNDAINKITNETKILEKVYIDFVNTLNIYKEFLTEEIQNNLKPTIKTSTNMDNQDQAYEEAEEKRQLLKKELEKEANDRKHESQSLYDKYMISLSTASLGFSVAFIKESDFIGKNYKWVIVVSWVFFVISTIITLISFRTSVSAYKKQLDDISNIFEGKTLSETMPSSNKYTRFFNKINIYTFIVGIILTFVYIYINL